MDLGTYCAEKAPLGLCLRKKRASCCFPTKLSRILHQQGRAQLSLSWGDPEHPNCRGFTVEELSQIDFDQLNLGELYDDMAARAQKATSKALDQHLKTRLTQIAQDFKNHPKEGEF